MLPDPPESPALHDIMFVHDPLIPEFAPQPGP